MDLHGPDAEFRGRGDQEADQRLSTRVFSGPRDKGHVAQASKVRADGGSAYLHPSSLPCRVALRASPRLTTGRFPGYPDLVATTVRRPSDP